QELKEETCFVTVVVWDKQAESCNQYLHKGSPIFIEGRLQSRSWEDNSGQKRSTLEVRAERVQFLGVPQAKAPTQPETEEAQEQPTTEDTWLEESEGISDGS
ncbi:MAG: single-stranded DNA-binding protein, partial [Candidatus Omnitrophica bacterium]|nr:single-stranded DNA-binding protein [Candidatus Omnitrophota bacterium]